jgi:deoxyribodipyrimidine photolyase-related protein
MERLKRIRLLLGDQLNQSHSWFDQVHDDTLYIMAEMHQEAQHPVQHMQKIVAFFHAMRTFARQLETKGHKVTYQSISEYPERSLSERIITLIELNDVQCFEYQLPDDYRLDKQLHEMSVLLKSRSITVNTIDTEHFLTHRYELSELFSEKSLLMERFYRYMRKKHKVLMDGDKPHGGKWNFDHENRKAYDGKIPIIDPLTFKYDVSSLVEEIKKAGLHTFGEIASTPFNWPKNYTDARLVLDYFCTHLLPHFGTYQDALYSNHSYLFHSRLSFAMNTKMIGPQEVIASVIQASETYRHTSLAQVEGFVRQVLGWREFMRGVYWKEMPHYKKLNFFNHSRPLPEFYWSGKTKMKCVSHAVTQTRNEAYAHHIQRLMVTGNFGLLAEIDPDAIDRWYLGVYADAIEWVEITNTRGMSQFADGGIIATKPYVSSGNYIDKMSDYCKQCHFNPKEKTGELACPFNALYWNFLVKKRAVLAANQRMSLMYRILDKKPVEELSAHVERAEMILTNLDKYLGE